MFKIKELWLAFKVWLMGEVGGYMNPSKPKNQWKHFLVWLIASDIFARFHSLIWALSPASKPTFNLFGFAFFVVILLAIVMEVNQAKGVKTPSEYWKLKWLDSLLDVAASAAGYLVAVLPWGFGIIGWNL